VKSQKVNFQPFIGQRVVRVNDRYPEQTFILTLERGYLSIECSWRIRARAILIGSSECNRVEGLSYRTVRELLRKRRIFNIIHSVQSSDLTIEFDGGLALDLFQDSSYWEAWELVGRGFEFHLVGLPGGDFAFFGDDAYVTVNK
jgi:hypothetical protein